MTDDKKEDAIEEIIWQTVNLEISMEDAVNKINSLIVSEATNLSMAVLEYKRMKHSSPKNCTDLLFSFFMTVAIVAIGTMIFLMAHKLLNSN